MPAEQCGEVNTGFEVLLMNGKWVPAATVELHADAHGPRRSLWVSFSKVNLSDVVDPRTGALSMRYLFADWPVPRWYAAESFLGPRGELPVAPFVTEVQISTPTFPVSEDGDVVYA